MAITCMFGSECHLTLLFSLVFSKKSRRKFFSNIIIVSLVTDLIRSLIVLTFGGEGGGVRGNNFTMMINANVQSALRCLIMIDTMMITAICVVFYCYDDDKRALCCF